MAQNLDTNSPDGKDELPATTDDAIDSKRHNRMYNPVDDAKRSSVSQQLNEDAARYKKGPGPV